jgi:outer membrane lipoprotein-sorting protein
MSSFRTISPRRLIAGIGGVVVLGFAGVGVGYALTGANPPAPQPLANALQQAAAGTKPTGITADVTFTNNLLSSAGLPGGDPLMSGASGRMWINGAGDLRIELQSSGGGSPDSQILATKTEIQVYDGTQNTVYKIALPADSSTSSTTSPSNGIPTVTEIQAKLDTLATHLNISGANPGTVGNVPSYSVTISPKHDGGLLGNAELAWDASNGVPLGVSVYSTTDPSTPVLALTVVDISYGPVDASALQISPPSDAKVVDVPLPAQSTSTSTTTTPVTGLSDVQAQVGFTIAAPATVDGLPQRQVRLVDWKGEKSALVTYGQGLGGIAVLERPAGTATPSSSPLSQLPTVSVAGVSGHELATPLGTVVTFTKNGVDFVVAGSVTQMAAQTAAGELS